MALLLLGNSCAVPIHDFPACSPLPGSLGATCDNFLTSNKQILNEAQWQALIVQWQDAGQALECIPSGAYGDLKAEIEKLCSVHKCDEATKQVLLKGLARIQSLQKTVE
jgi:hypothetical protein